MITTEAQIVRQRELAMEIVFLRQAILAEQIRRQLDCAVDARERRLLRERAMLTALLREQK